LIESEGPGLSARAFGVMKLDSDSTRYLGVRYSFQCSWFFCVHESWTRWIHEQRPVHPFRNRQSHDGSPTDRCSEAVAATGYRAGPS